MIAVAFLPHPLRVAIDGIDAAGKTFLADELAPRLDAINRPAIRVSLDSFHRPRDDRYRLGPASPEGYYLDSFNYPEVIRMVLDPLSPGGDGRYCPAVFDLGANTRLPEKWSLAPENAVLLVDGIFLLRPELNLYWDLRIFLRISFNTSLERGVRRDLSSGCSQGMAEHEALRQRYLQRYIPGQKLYLNQVQPEGLGDIIIENDDLERPLIFDRRPLTTDH
jgi:uridine kinase